MNQTTQAYLIGEHQLNPESRTLCSAAGAHRLSPRLYVLISLLAARAGEPVCRDRLIDQAWDGKPGVNRALNRHIATLRRYLGDDRQHTRYIETIPGYGYRLIAPVTAAGPYTPQLHNGASSKTESADGNPGFWHFLVELRERKVCRAAALYMITVWLIFQVAEVVFPALGLPDWALSFIVITGTLGLPIAILLAWAFEITPAGLTLDIPRREPNELGPLQPGRRTRTAVLGLGGLLAACVVGRVFNGADSDSRTELATLRDARTVIVEPFRATSVDLDTEALAFGLSQELRYRLRTDADLRVISTRTESGSDVRRHDADLLFQGSVTMGRGVTRVLLHLVDPRDGHDVWSELIEMPHANSGGAREGITRRILASLPIGRADDSATPATEDLDTASPTTRQAINTVGPLDKSTGRGLNFENRPTTRESSETTTGLAQRRTCPQALSRKPPLGAGPHCEDSPTVSHNSQ